MTPEQVVRGLKETGMAFIFAPSYHPVFKVVAPVRKALAARGKRSLFNLLGPLLNPARPEARVVGVFSPDHVSLYHETLKLLGHPRHAVVFGRDSDGRALGEWSVTGSNSTLPELAIQPSGNYPGLKAAESLQVADAVESARRIEAVLQGSERGLARGMVVENAALGILVQGTAGTWAQAKDMAREALDSGGAMRLLERWRKLD